MTGEQGRKAFLNDQSLNMGEGHKILSGAAPRLTDINIGDDGTSDHARRFIHRLLLLLRKERVADGAYHFWCSYLFLVGTSSVLPILMDDLNGRMLDWGSKGKINPFKEVYDVSSVLLPRQPMC